MPIDIENTEYFLNITMISGDNLETGPSGNFSFFDAGIQTVYIQTEDINNCYSSFQENFEVNTADNNLFPQVNIDSTNIPSCKLPYDLIVGFNSDNTENINFNWELYINNNILINSSLEDFEYNIVEPGYYELILEAHADEFTCPLKDT